jgi:microcystin-dependent protein
MSDPFLGEIKIFAGNFAPRGYSFCDGQLIPISQNTALFSIIGTIYGGDGRTDFALPNLQGRAPMHEGSGAGLTPRALGLRSGTETVTLTSEAQLGAHNHQWGATDEDAAEDNPSGRYVPVLRDDGFFSGASDVNMGANMVAAIGGNQAHNNMQPFLVLNFIIVLVGTFPSRN